jgi:hypothetical protein
VPYEINAGRYQTVALETHVVDHCNLACVDCCTRSPDLAPRFAEPAEIERDLRRLGRVLAPQTFKLTGGEPLLHPDISGIARLVRNLAVAERISLTTNGFLLHKAPDALFESLDAITLSFYPSKPLPEERIEEAEKRAARHGIHLTVKLCDEFQVMDRPGGKADRETQAIYDQCWLKVRCHLMYAGHFFLCTRPPHLSPPVFEDGVELAGEFLLQRVGALLNRAEGLESCRRCRGASGVLRSHRQRARPSLPVAT